MNKKPLGARDRTRRAILEAVADVIAEANGIGFSVQTVADRAGVTHRTVYNHFATREALCEGFSDYVDELLVAVGRTSDPALHRGPASAADFTMESLPSTVDTLYRTLGLRDRYVRAYVMLMIGNRRPLETWRTRTQALEKVIAGGTGDRPPLPPRQMAAAIRLFVSSMGWHLLTEQCGLSTDEAAATSAWATRTLLTAAAGRRATPSSTRSSQKGAHAKRRRRS